MIRVLFALERFVYSRADAITVIGHGMRNALPAKGVPEGKVHWIPNFVDLVALRPGPRMNSLRTGCGLGDSVVVTYAGSIDFAQDVVCLSTRLCTCLRPPRSRSCSSATAPSGGRSRRARTADLTRVNFVGHQPYSRMPELYATSDLCVAALAHGSSAEAIPSKIFRIMACRRPVLALAAVGSDLARGVNAAGAGAVVSLRSPEEIAQALLDLAGAPERCEAAGRSGRRWVEQRYGRSVVTGRYVGLLAGLADARGR